MKNPDLALGSPISFYNGEVTLRFSERDHIYYREDENGLDPLDGVTNVCGIIDKSLYLIPWSCKVAAEKLLRTMPRFEDTADLLPQIYTESIKWTDFETLVNAAKSAHREKLVDAGDVGVAAHAWIEDSIRWAITFNGGVCDRLTEQVPDDERAQNCGNAALDWMQTHKVRWLKTEHKIYSRQWKYAGTMDGLAEVNGRRAIVDWKTSNSLRFDYYLQTAAYLQAHIEEFPDIDITDRWILRLGKEDGKFEPWHVGPETIGQDFEAFKLCLLLKRQRDIIERRIADSKKVRTQLKKATKKENR